MSAVFKQEMIVMPGVEKEAVGFFGNVFPFFVVIIFLFLGFSMGLDTSARGTQRLIAGFRAAHKAAQIKTLQAVARTSGRLLAAPIRAPIREIGIIRRAYQAERAGGFSRTRALARAMGGYMWRLLGRGARRIGRGIVAEAREAREIARMLRELIFSIRRGIVGAIRDAAEAGLRGAGVRIPQRRGFRTCPTCGNNRVAASATACPTCGHVF
jgi:hypothetical protein